MNSVRLLSIVAGLRAQIAGKCHAARIRVRRQRAVPFQNDGLFELGPVRAEH